MQVPYLNAQQGNVEERNDMYTEVQRVSTENSDAVERQKHQQSGELCLSAGWCGMEVAYDV